MEKNHIKSIQEKISDLEKFLDTIDTSDLKLSSSPDILSRILYLNHQIEKALDLPQPRATDFITKINKP